MQQGPKLGVAAQNYVAATSAIAAIGAAFRYKLFATERGCTRATLTAFTMYFNVVYKIFSCHITMPGAGLPGGRVSISINFRAGGPNQEKSYCLMGVHGSAIAIHLIYFGAKGGKNFCYRLFACYVF